MLHKESAWVQKRDNRRPTAAPPRRFAAHRDPAACRSEAEDLLRDLAFVFRTTQRVRTAITGGDKQ